MHGNCEFMEVEYIEAVDSAREMFLRVRGRNFYSAVGIDERKNKNLWCQICLRSIGNIFLKKI